MSDTIRLDRADFFELQALFVKVENAQLVLRIAQAAAQAKFDALAAAHGVDPTAHVRLEEATCSLVPA